MRSASALGKLALAALLLGTGLHPAHAEVPKTLLYQGALYDGAFAAEGDFDMQFRIFPTQQGGAALATHELKAVSVFQGGFSVDVEALFRDVGAGELWLEVSVKAEDDDAYDTLPRVAVSSVPYALRAAVADSIDWSQVQNAPPLLKGEPGAPGPQGVVGPVGPLGPVGPAGPAGPAGPRGLSGPAGAIVAESLGVRDPNCPTGGAAFRIDSETTYVCNGAVGAVGARGVAGPAGASGPQGAAGPMGPQGPAGALGPVGPQGRAGESVVAQSLAVGNANCPTGGASYTVGGTTTFVCRGAAGAAGPQGSQGPQGPQGPVGSSGAITVRDADDRELGRLVSFGAAPWSPVNAGRTSVALLTSTNHLVYLGLDGSVASAPLYWTQAGCTGVAYLNTGGGAATAYSKLVVRSEVSGSLYAPSSGNGNNIAASVNLTSAATENPTCATSAGARQGIRLSAVSRSAIGLPGTITPPLQF